MSTAIDPIETPTARDDELDLIACVLNGADPDRLHLGVEHFDGTQTREAWRAILHVANTGGRPDPTTVRLALGGNGSNAAPWLIDVFARPVVPGNADALAAKLRRTAHLRDLQGLAIRINRQCFDPDADPLSIVEMVRREIDKPIGAIHTTRTLGDVMPNIIDELESGAPSGLSTPWPELDRKIHGLTPGALYIVAARPGVGKSLLGQNLALHWSRHHHRHSYFASVEMKTEELAKRALSQTSRVYLSRLLDGGLMERDWDQITTATAILGDDLVHICDDPGQTLESIRSGAREVKRRHGLGLVVVDYLQLVTPSDRRMVREQQVAEVSRGLKLLAKELDVPVVAMAQLRRLQESKPTLQDLRESGSIEQDADAVMLLHIPDAEIQHIGELLVAKARAGTRGPVALEMLTHWATIQAPRSHNRQEQA